MENTTLKDIAAKLNISAATVSRALNSSGYVSQEVKEKVLRTAEEMNYIPNAIAKSLKKRRTNTIGMVVPDIANEYYLTAAKGIEDTLYLPDMTLVFSSSNESITDEKRILKVMVQQRVDILVLATAGSTLEDLHSVGVDRVPVILFDRTIEGASYEIVVDENYQKAYSLTEQVIKKGHKNIGIIVGSRRVSPGRERIRGIQTALEDYGISLPKTNYFYGDFTREYGKLAADYFLDFKVVPTAIVSSNNSMTLGLINRLFERSKNGASQIFIASYGRIDLDTMFDSDHYGYVEQDPYGMGVTVGHIINRVLQDKGDE